MLACAVQLAAQTATVTSTVDAAAQAMTGSLKFRGDLADAVAKGSVDAAVAITRLKAQGKVTGLDVDADVDFAYGAIDLGRRLAALKPAVAVTFFEAAEQSLGAVIQRTPDTSAKDKAQLLCQLAIIRCAHLGKATQARQDIDQAIALQPKDSYLKQARRVMASSHAEQFRTEGGKP